MFSGLCFWARQGNIKKIKRQTILKWVTLCNTFLLFWEVYKYCIKFVPANRNTSETTVYQSTGIWHRQFCAILFWCPMMFSCYCQVSNLMQMCALFHETQASTKEKTTTKNNPHVFMYIQNKSTTPQLMIPVLSINPFLHFYIAMWRRRLWRQKMWLQLNTLWCEYTY